MKTYRHVLVPLSLVQIKPPHGGTSLTSPALGIVAGAATTLPVAALRGTANEVPIRQQVGQGKCMWHSVRPAVYMHNAACRAEEVRRRGYTYVYSVRGCGGLGGFAETRGST